MVARKVTARLKPSSLARFADVMEREVLPWLRAQEGFLDLVTLATPDGNEITTISFWDHPASAEAYSGGAYPVALKILGELLDGASCVKTFEVVSSSLPAAIRGSEADPLIQEAVTGQLGYRACENIL